MKKAFKSKFKYSLNLIRTFVLWSSGVNRSLLCKAPLDVNKYLGIGGTVIFTALMAALSGAYAIYTTFQNYAIAIILGIFWGALIFNLDRFFVSTIHLQRNSFSTYFQALPRLLMAIVLGIVIATPLELKLFERAIESQIQQEIFDRESITHEKIDFDQKYNTTTLINKINNLEESIQKRLLERQALNGQYSDAYQLYMEELDGTGGSKQKGEGPIFREKKAHYLDLNNRLNQLNISNNRLDSLDREKLNNLEKELQIIKSNNQLRLNQFTESNERNTGLAARISALHNLSQTNSAIRWANRLLSLIFILIELSPILFKLLLSKGAYDVLYLNTENKTMKEQGFEITELNQVYALEQKLSHDYYEKLFTALVEMNQSKVDKVVEEDNKELMDGK